MRAGWLANSRGLLFPLVAVFLGAVDQTVVVTALPEIMRDLEVLVNQFDKASWVVNGYLLGYIAVLPIAGPLADRMGYRKVLLVALGVFTGASAGVAAAPGFWPLVVARVIQAAGGGALLPVTMAQVTRIVRGSRQGYGLGTIGAVAEGGAVLEPAYGGLILRYLSWRWIFWLNLPLGFLLMGLITQGTQLPRQSIPSRPDWIMAVGMTAGLALVTLGLFHGAGAPGIRLFLMVGVGVAALVAVAWRSRLTGGGNVPFWRPWRGPGSALLVHSLVGVALIIAMVNIPFITNTVMGRDPITGASRLVRLMVMLPAGALLGGVACRFGMARLAGAGGLALAGVGFAFMGGWTADTAESTLTVHLLVTGLGLGLVIAPVAVSALATTAEEYRATMASWTVLARLAGMLLGLAALASWGTAHFQTLLSGVTLLDPAYGEQANAAGLVTLQRFFMAGAGVSFVGAVMLLALREPWARPQRPETSL